MPRTKITGTDADDILDGTTGDDRILGLGGVDEIRGGKGADRIEGGEGDDLLEGQKGADVLIGDAGADRMFGGHGRDAGRREDSELRPARGGPLLATRTTTARRGLAARQPDRVARLARRRRTRHYSTHGLPLRQF